MKRRASSFNTQRIDRLYQDIHSESNFHLHYGGLSGSSSLIRLVHDIEPDEIYNLAAQPHVKVSWDCPEYTADNDGLGTLRLLEAVRINKFENRTKFYQASTSELYGLIQEPVQTGKLLFIRARLMRALNYTPAGYALTTGKASVCMHLTAYCSTTNRRAEVKHLLRAK